MEKVNKKITLVILLIFIATAQESPDVGSKWKKKAWMIALWKHPHQKSSGDLASKDKKGWWQRLLEIIKNVPLAIVKMLVWSTVGGIGCGCENWIRKDIYMKTRYNSQTCTLGPSSCPCLLQSDHLSYTSNTAENDRVITKGKGRNCIQ